MADLAPLIRLHRHNLDQKRRALGELYRSMGVLEQELQKLEAELAAEREKSNELEVAYTFAQYIEAWQLRRRRVELLQQQLDKQIEAAKNDLIETFSELKKYEMTQAERDRLEEEERAFKESQAMDAIGLENFRRNKDGE